MGGSESIILLPGIVTRKDKVIRLFGGKFEFCWPHLDLLFQCEVFN